MQRKMSRLIGLSRTCTLACAALLVAASAANAQKNSNHPVCQAIASGKIQASSGAQMWCFGPQPNGANPSNAFKIPTLNLAIGSAKGSGNGFTATNINAADLAEDVSGSGVRADGQSEVSIAAAGPYVVEAWNDSTSFFAPCPSPNNKEEATGFAFSSDGGKTFTDLGGLPNANCATSRYEGDPSVEAYQVGGNTYFYISSIFIPFTVPQNDLAITACQVLFGPPASLSCGQPIVDATSSDCVTPFPGFTFCSLLDKEFLTLDAAHGRLYTSYTEFDPAGITTVITPIELASCDLGDSLGAPGPLGGTPAAPVCENGSMPSLPSTTTPPAPYFVVAPGDNVNGCEREGAYPAADPANGDVYVAHEFNWFTNVFNFNCLTIPTQEEVAVLPSACLTLPLASCSAPSTTASVPITSMDVTFVPGYNRIVPSDFPRIAVSDASGAVSMVWNDARSNPLGDILLQSYNLATLTPVQAAPVKLNNDSGIGTLHFLPALRNVDAQGNLDVSWYDRRLHPNSALTDCFAALGVSPRTTKTPKSNTRVSNVSSDWLAVSSLIIPNFGDYTDNYINLTVSKMYAAWSDGRLGIPQPFMADQRLK